MNAELCAKLQKQQRREKGLAIFCYHSKVKFDSVCTDAVDFNSLLLLQEQNRFAVFCVLRNQPFSLSAEHNSDFSSDLPSDYLLRIANHSVLAEFL